MPREALTAANYEFGPVAGGVAALQWAVKRGRRLSVVVESLDADTVFSVQVSQDGTSWNAASDIAAVALTSVTVVAGGKKTYAQNLRSGLDNYLRVLCPSGARCTMQIRGDAVLDVQKV